MRLAIVTHNVIRGDGQSRVALEIARFALAQGVSVSLLADRVNAEIRDLGAQWIPVNPRFQRVHLFKVREFAHRANQILGQRRDEFDTVQAFGFSLSRSHAFNNSQFVHKAWAQSPMHTSRMRQSPYSAYQWLYTRLNTRWERQAYQKAEVVIASSHEIKDQIARIGVPKERIHVIWNGVDLTEFHPGVAPRGPLGLPEDVPLAVFAGDIRTPRKNLDTVLHALVDVPELHLAVVGSTEHSPYPEMAAKLRIDQRVHFLGFRRDVAVIMRAADMFVFPTHYEPFGLVITEAMASGIPVVISRCAGAAELIEDGVNGILLEDASNATMLTNFLRQLTEAPELRRRIGEAARATAEQHSWTYMAEAHLRLYERFC